jgi:photosystem II stability/assembly factor-like uncharacterized protein
MKKSLLALFGILLFLGAENSFAQGFNSVTSPDGIFVVAVGDAGLLFRSSDGGNTFAQLSVGAEGYKDVCSYGDNVWFCGTNGKIYLSSKEVQAVTPVTAGSSTLNGIDFVDNNIGYSCGVGGVVYKSTNGGATWDLSNTGIPAVDLNAISFKDASNGVVVGDNGVVYTTANGGSSWTVSAAGTTKKLLDVEYYSDGYVIAGVDGTLLIKPTSSSYSSVDMKTDADVRGITGTSITDVVVAGGGGFIRSNSSSPEFLNFEANPMMANLVDIHYANANMGFAVSSLNKAIIRTTNGGTNWQFMAGVTPSYSWQSRPGPTGNFLGMNLVRHPYDKHSYFVVFSNRVYVSRDDGETWSQTATVSPSSGTPHTFLISAADTNVWLLARTGSPDNVTRTTDHGATWNIVHSQNFTSYGEPLEHDPNNPSTFYFAPDNGGYYKSTNNGASFSQISAYPFRSPCDLLIDAVNPDIQFIADGVTGSGVAEIFRSANGGVNWTKVWTNPSSSEIPTISNTVFEPNLMRATNWSGSNIYKSTNNGVNWALDYSTTHSGWGANFCAEDPNVYMSGSWTSSGNNTTTFSYDGGNTRLSVSGLSGAGGFMLLNEKGTILAQAGSSLYKFRVQYDVVTAIQEITLNSGIPADFNLSQNYPNPFNPSTRIRYDLPEKGSVKLVVFDQLGRQVSELINGVKNAGSYEVEFNGSNLASGIYFYKLEVSEQTFTKKMILVK